MKEAKPLTEGYIPSGKKGDYNYYGGFNDGIEEGAKQERERILKILKPYHERINCDRNECNFCDIERRMKELKK